MILKTFMQRMRFSVPVRASAALMFQAFLLLGGTSNAYAQAIDLNLLTDAALKACVTAEAARRGLTDRSQVDSLVCLDKGIASTAGLSQFTRLRTLGLGNNRIPSIDLTPFTELEHLNLASNQLTAIDVSRLSGLRDLGIENNLLTSLNVDSNTRLEALSASQNRLTALSVRNNTALSFLGLNNNQLTQLDVSRNVALQYLVVGFNQLTALNISSNPKLITVNADVNRLTAINTSNNPALETLRLQNNLIHTLDVSRNTKLLFLGVSSNPLDVQTIQTLQARNGTAGFVVNFGGSLRTASFPGGISGTLGGGTTPVGTTIVVFTVSASGTYNFRLSSSAAANTPVPIGYMQIVDEAGNATGDLPYIAPLSSALLQAKLETGRSYRLNIQSLGTVGVSVNYLLNVTKAELHTITGRIIDAEGRPARGVEMIAMADTALLGRALTNQYGVYTIQAYGAPETTVYVSDQFDRYPRYAYAGNSAGMAPGTYDASLSGYVKGTDLDLSTRDLRNINMQIGGTTVAGELNPGTTSLGNADSVRLELRTSDFDSGESVYVDLNAAGGPATFDPVNLVPNARYEIRAQLQGPSSGTSGEYRKVFPTFLRTDAYGKLSTYNFSLPAGSFAFDPSLSSSWNFASSTAALREDGSFASSTLISPNRSFSDSLGLEGSFASSTPANAASTDTEDYYVFRIGEPTRYEFAVSVAVSSAVLQLELFDSNQSRLFTVSGNNLGAGASPDLARTLPAGTYYLRVSATSGSSAYTLHLEPSTRNIQLSPAFYSSPSDNVGLDRVVNPVDYYRFRAQSAGLHYFTAQYNPVALGLRLILRDANNAVINAGNIDRLSHTLVAGTDYILEVRADSGAGDYVLGIEPESARKPALYTPRGGALPQ